MSASLSSPSVRAGAFVCALTLLGGLCAPATAAGAGDAPGRLSYAASLVPAGNEMRLVVELSFPGGDAGRTRLYLPNHFSGQRALYRNVRNLRAVSPGASLADTDQPDVKALTFPPGRDVRVRYEIAPDPQGASAQPGAYFRPWLSPREFHGIGTTLWAYPAQYGKTVSASLHWTLPPGWTFCGSFGAGQADQSFTGTLEQFLASAYLAGDYRLRTVRAAGQPVTLALRGKARDDALAAVAGRIVGAEREFWGDGDAAYFLVALIPAGGAGGTAESRGDGGGVELTHAVLLFGDTGRSPDFRLEYVLAHEMFHTWNAGEIRSDGLYWFSEGFTDYYARLLLLRAGLISADEYARDVNRVVREYAQSPARGRPGGEAARDFYAGSDLSRLPYQQGMLLAARWNAQISVATGGRCSLDDAMRDLRRTARADDAPVTAQDVAGAVLKYAPHADPVGDVRRVVDAGGMLAPEPGALGPGFALRPVKVSPFEAGFDARATLDARVVSGVRPGSRAFWAGLRDGQEVLACTPWTPGDAQGRIAVTVRDAGGPRDIEWTPAGDPVLVPQFVRVRSVSDADCRAWFGNPARPAGR